MTEAMHELFIFIGKADREGERFFTERCQGKFRVRIGLIVHLRTQPINRLTTAAAASATAPAPAFKSITSAPTPTKAASNPRAAMSSAPITTFPSNTATTSSTTTSTTAASGQNVPDVPRNPPPPLTWAQFIPVLISIAHSPLTSAWSVTCESTIRRLIDQCLEHQNTPDIFVSTARTALTHSAIAWAC
ncbi:hypothetical protein SprV_0401525700 [Sparganum proliferum]